MNSLVNQLSTQLGIDPAQAELGVEAFLKLVQDQAPEQLDPLVSAIPGGSAFASRMAPGSPAAALDADSLSGFGELLGGLLGGGGAKPAARPDRDGGLDDLLGGLGGLLGGSRQSGSGGGLGDLLGGILGGGDGAESRTAPASGGFGDLLGGILGGGAAPAQAGGGAALMGFLAILLKNGFSMESAARFLPVLLGLLRGRAGDDVLGGLMRNVPLLKEVLGGATARQTTAGREADDGFGLDDLLGQVLGRR